jgi:hypothetical protein
LLSTMVASTSFRPIEHLHFCPVVNMISLSLDDYYLSLQQQLSHKRRV